MVLNSDIFLQEKIVVRPIVEIDPKFLALCQIENELY